LPLDGSYAVVDAKRGDIIVAYTDGVGDNLFLSTITHAFQMKFPPPPALSSQEMIRKGMTRQRVEEANKKVKVGLREALEKERGGDREAERSCRGEEGGQGEGGERYDPNILSNEQLDEFSLFLAKTAHANSMQSQILSPFWLHATFEVRNHGFGMNGKQDDITVVVAQLQ
tara:strand:+ start:222 stop:734 length:513 start_codon:yes stop_codon:yes gene_type:complete